MNVPGVVGDDATNDDTTGSDATSDRSVVAMAIAEAAPDGVLVVDRVGTIRYANPAIHRLAGVDGDLVGRNVDELVPDAARSDHAARRAGFVAEPLARPMGTGLDLQLQRSDGTLVPVEIALSPFEHDELLTVAAVRDVTERRQIAEALAAADRQVALLDERERIGRDLHDVVLQRLYGTGLTVQAIGAGTDETTRDRLDGVIDEIDRIIAEVRTIVFTLGHSGRGGGSLGQDLADIVAQASRVLGFTPALRLDGPVESVLGDEARIEMLASMREALGNVARHAAASTVEVAVQVRDRQVVMSVRDDGVGVAETNGSIPGHGLANLRARAAALGGHCELRGRPKRGAELMWSVPY